MRVLEKRTESVCLCVCWMMRVWNKGKAKVKWKEERRCDPGVWHIFSSCFFEGGCRTFPSSGLVLLFFFFLFLFLLFLIYLFFLCGASDTCFAQMLQKRQEKIGSALDS